MKFREALTVWRARGFTGRLCRAKDIHDGCPCVYYTARQDDTGGLRILPSTGAGKSRSGTRFGAPYGC